jgi:pimeloyl-ACP methyl ester carboxylesterase
MPTITTTNTGIEIFYEDHGDAAHPVILLVMGLGAQLTLWPDELVEALTGEGFRVIRYDNRDIGLSQKLEGERAPRPATQVLRKKFGWPARVPYTLADMAADGIGLMDALAIDHPERLLSLTSIMSTTGNPKLPPAEKHAIGALIAPLAGRDEETMVAHGLNIVRNIGSPGFPADPETQRAKVLRAMRRSVYPAGLPRQLAAIIDDGDRRTRLAQVRVPTLVMHGEADPLIKLPAAEDTAAAIPGARLVTFPGWGHDFPIPLIPRIATEIAAHARGG